MSDRLARERLHGERLAATGAEQAWGWGTAAGQRRAARRAQLIADAAALGPGVRALEVGCGTGVMTRHFTATGAQVVALELSPDLLALARRHTMGTGVTFVLSAFEDYEADRPFDAVVGSSVLHHLAIVPALRRVHELLRPGGRMAFAEPNMLNPQVWMERTLRHLPPFSTYVSPDETAIIRWEVQQVVARLGFTNVAVRPFDWLHPSTPGALVPLVDRAGLVLERLPGIRELAGSVLISAERVDE